MAITYLLHLNCSSTFLSCPLESQTDGFIATATTAVAAATAAAATVATKTASTRV